MTRAGIVLGLCLAGLGCRPRPVPNNLVLVTFDTTRADHLGCYGRANARTPTLDGLASRGVLFEQCRSAAPITMPSHSTIMTGLYPPAHSVRDNGLFALPESRVTLAEILKARGYATGAATGSFVLDRRFGLSQGFDVYEDGILREYENFWGDRAVEKKSLFFDERPAERVNAAILPWLRKNRDKPFFLWVHYWDAHQPHIPPPPYSEVFATDLYQGEISYADSALGQLLRELDAGGVAQRTVVVMTADHGEGLDQHNEATHSLLCYDGTLHVPLIVAGPGVAAGKRVKERVGTVDIVPTVLDLLGARAPADVHGRSLAPLWKGSGEGDARRGYYAETLSPRISHGLGELRAWFEGPFKYIHGPRSELYDLRNDPAELHNLILEDPQTAAGLRDRLTRFLERTARPAEEAAAPANTAENLERLAALGYVSQGGTAPRDVKDVLRSDGTAPQDRVGDIDRISSAKTLLLRNQYREAKDVAEILLRSAPDDPMYIGLVAWAESGLGQQEAALKRLERMDVLPRGSTWVYPLIDRMAVAGHTERALALVGKALAKDRDNAQAYALRAEILRQMGRQDDFMAALRDALKADPLYLPARLELGVALAQRGERAEAQKEMEAVLRQNPLHPRGHFNYGALMSELGRWQEARLHFARALELDANYCKSYAALVTADLQLGDRAGAAATVDRLQQHCRDDDALEEAEAMMQDGSGPR